ncbi:MAG: hypothetical protein VW169_05040 [Rhodospirillaceae bacterium]
MSSPTPYLVDMLSRAALRLLQTAGGQTFEADEFSVRLIGPDVPDRAVDTLAGPIDKSADVKVVADYTLQVDSPRRVMQLTWSADDMLRILVFSRGGCEESLLAAAGIELDQALNARASSWRRLQGTEDALLKRVLTDNGLYEVPLASFRKGKIKERPWGTVLACRLRLVSFLAGFARPINSPPWVQSLEISLLTLFRRAPKVVL